ncbi:hypothetical protein LTR85_000488 [Meristemomyces frigidus]|nr:hypothetical protein LTR85_000488 [Meristemomyces frigidus]
MNRHAFVGPTAAADGGKESSTNLHNTAYGNRSVVQANTINNLHQYNEKPVDLDHKCLRSLYFRNMDVKSGDKERAAGSGDWIFEHKHYRQWHEDGGVLWMRGRAGCGKSMLMSRMIAEAQKDSNRGGSVMCFFFHAHGDTLQSSAVGMFRALLHQMLSNDAELLAAVVVDSRFDLRCDQHGPPGDKWDWGHVELQEAFKRIIRQLFQNDRRAYIYVDAMDEAGEADATELIALLKKAGDIEAYLVDQFARLAGHRMEEEVQEIVQELRSRAAGVFQWVAWVCKQVVVLAKSDESTQYIIDKIDGYPEELALVYEDVLRQIPDNELEIATKLFEWRTLARRPLTAEDLRYAVCLEPHSPVESMEEIEELNEGKHWCASERLVVARATRFSHGLIKKMTVTDPGPGPLGDSSAVCDVLTYDHQSVHEYMSNKGLLALLGRLSKPSAPVSLAQKHLLVAKSCLWFLMTEEVVSYTQSRKGVTVEEDCLDKALDALLAPGEECQLDPNDSISTLRRTCLRELEAQNGIGLSPLAVAAVYGHRRVVELLLQYGSRIDSATPKTLTPLHLAAAGGHKAVVQALLRSNGIAVDAKDDGGHTPLDHAVRGNRVGVVKLLLSKSDFGVHSTDVACESEIMRYISTPLINAWIIGDLAMLKVVLSCNRIDGTLCDVWGQTLLHYISGPKLQAASILDIEKTRLLIDSGKLSLDCKDKEGCTPLMTAAKHGDAQLVKLLLASGKVDVRATNKDDDTPLLYAVGFGQAEVVKLLLQTTDPGLHHMRGGAWSPLLVAVDAGRFEIVRLLVSSGRVNVTASVGSGPSALALAQHLQDKGDDRQVRGEIHQFLRGVAWQQR